MLKNRITAIIATTAAAITIVTGLIFLYNTFWKPTPIDLTGKWQMNFIVKESTYKPYINMDTGYVMYLQQDENKVSAKGEKWTLDGDTLPYKNHRPFEFEGKVTRDNFTASYILHGSKRKTVGEFTLVIKDDGRNMEGNFSGTAADSKGIVYAKRLK